MLKRLASIGQRDPDDHDEPMPQSPGDVPPTPDSSRPSGLASVFKGLTNSRLAKSPPPTTPPLQSPPPPPPRLETANANSIISPVHMESLAQLRDGTPSERIAAATVLRHAVSDYPLNPVLDIWNAAKDMIEPGKTTESRVAGWELLTECAKHTSSTDLERKEFFQTLTATNNAADFHLQLAALVDLTRNGRELSGFDYEVLPLLRNWLLEAYREVKQARRHVSRAAKAITKSRVAAASALASGEEKNFAQLFRFVIDVIKFNFNVADDVSVGNLIDCLLNICMDTTVEEDLRHCIAVLNAIVTFGAIPQDRLKGCVQVLGSIYCLVHGLEKDAWNTLSILCRSHNGQATVRILLDILRNSPGEGTKEKDANREIRGALAVLRKLLGKSAEKGYPAVPFSLLVDGLATTAKSTASTKAQAELLRVVNSLFDKGDGTLHHLLVDEDWSVLLDLAAECAKRSVTSTQAQAQALPESSITVTPTDGGDNLSRNPDAPPREDRDRGEDVIVYELLRLIARLEVLIDGGVKEFVPRQTLVVFFTSVHPILPDSAARSVLSYFQDFQCCSPSDVHWEENLDLVLKAFFADRKRTSGTRLQALQIITDALEILGLVGDRWADLVPSIVRCLLVHVTQEADILVLDAIVTLMVSVAAEADMELFDYIVTTLQSIVVGDQLRSPVTLSSMTQSPSPTTLREVTKQALAPSSVVTRGYVRLFMRLMGSDGIKSARIFDCLVFIAKSDGCEIDARLSAMKFLFRLRSDWENHIFVTSNPEAETLAASLHRTEASLRQKKAEDASQTARLSRGDLGSATSRTSRGISFGQGSAERVFQFPNRTSGSAKHHSHPVQRYEQIWGYPDSRALPESNTECSSPLLVSQNPYREKTTGDKDNGGTEWEALEEDAETSAEEENSTHQPSGQRLVQLDVASWLAGILHLFRTGCDWEIYSFVLVHLPSQLSNHSLFTQAIDKVHELRKVLCEQIRMNSFQEPPNTSGLRRADVAICLFHSLTVILSYHDHFQKHDEDDMVRTFVHGITTWERSAKACIHALSICCHELPMSTSKSLLQMLQKMAQIITQPHVAMHILEFLAGLSRMPELYVNFREDEYRIVFGIAFRYLQYVRDKRQSQRNSDVPASAVSYHHHAGDQSPHPSAADDLPQYVYALAYHVITFWFMALRLPDRAGHVGWIAKNLFTDVDGAQGEEQALIAMDFMQRVAYSDADESAADALFTRERFGNMAKRQWLVGNSIITVQQATDTGWTQIIKRQPSGTSSYTIRESFKRPPPHQVRNPTEVSRDGHQQPAANAMLPNHIMVQLMASIPQTVDAFRPVPLPDEDAVDRAIRLFDMTPTVDGHKVGCIYIGEGQTDEIEILANVSGSIHYHEFLDGLGTLVKLQGASFNTQGLDKEYGTDGLYTVCWRDRVSEIVFHVTTQMPTDLENDARCINKKRHIGNDYVSIIFNDSGLPFQFDTFASQFNYVNIVITPERGAPFVATDGDTNGRHHGRYIPLYRVTVMSKPGFPEISPAAETKIISLKALPGFVRLLAINASVFSQVWANREGGEHISTWRARLREIKRLRDKYGPKVHQQFPGGSVLSAATTPSPPPSALGGAIIPQQQQMDGNKAGVRDSFSSFRRSSVATFLTSTSEQTSHRSSVLSTTTTHDAEVVMSTLDALVDSVDFSKWA